MGFFEKHKKTGYGVFYNIDNSGTKNLHTIPFSGFYLAAKATIAVFAARFPSSSILSNQLLGLFLGKVAVVLPKGKTPHRATATFPRNKPKSWLDKMPQGFLLPASYLTNFSQE